ncbi:MAG: hypothetical protein AAGA45_02580 [Verrucomicrobiota bacterium]
MMLQKKLVALAALCLTASFTSPRAKAVFNNPCVIVNIASRDNPLQAGWLDDSLFYLSAKMRSSKLRELSYDQAVQADDSIPGMENEENKSVLDIQGEIRFLPPEEGSTFDTGQ